MATCSGKIIKKISSAFKQEMFNRSFHNPINRKFKSRNLNRYKEEFSGNMRSFQSIKHDFSSTWRECQYLAADSGIALKE